MEGEEEDTLQLQPVPGSNLQSATDLNTETDLNEDDEVEESHAIAEYVSCIRINGKAILPPVMTDERRRECREWRLKAVRKEEELRQNRNRRTAGRIEYFLEDLKFEMKDARMISSTSCPVIPDLDLSDTASEVTEPDLTPKSFRDIQKMLKDQRYSEQDTARSSSTSMSGTSTPSTSSVLGYNSNLYSDHQPHPEPESLELNEQKTELYDSLFSLNTVIENPSSRLTLHDESSRLSSPDESSRLSLLDESSRHSLHNESINIESIDTSPSLLLNELPRLQNKTVEEILDITVTPPPKETVANNEARNDNSSVLEQHSGSPPEKESSPSSPLTEDESDKENFRPRRGSYSLEKPSPLLQAHLDKFGNSDNIHDMSNYQRTPSPAKQKAPSSRILTPRRPSTDCEKQQVLSSYLETLKSKPSILPKSANQKLIKSTPEGLTSDQTGRVSLDAKPEPTEGKDISTESLRSTSALSSVNPRSGPAPTPAPLHPPPSRSFSVASSVSTENSHLSRREIPSLRIETPSTTHPRTGTLSDASQRIESPVDPSLRVETPSTLSTRTLTEPLTVSSTTSALEQAVSDLARSHQESLARLIMKQEEERRQLRGEFEARQKMLIQQIVEQFPNLGNVDALTEPERAATPTLSNLSNLTPSTPVVTKQTSVHSNSPAVRSKPPVFTLETPLKASPVPTLHSPSPSIHSRARSPVTGAKATAVVRLVVPPQVYEARYARAWVQLTALARGYLVRKLVATEKVQFLKRTIRETLACAVKLHLEIEGPPSRQDLDLHARLLAQLESACQSVHNIFFKLGIPERMSIIALDRAAATNRNHREAERGVEKKVSAATLSRLEQKTKESSSRHRQSPRWLVKRRRSSRSTSRDGRRSNSSVQLQSSRRTKSSQNISKSSQNISKSSHNISKSTGSPYKSSMASKKPAWK